VQQNKAVLEDANVWGVGDVNFSPAVSLFRVSFRFRHEWVKRPELTANIGSTGFTISHATVVDLTKPQKERGGAGISETPRYILQK
jgi:hypothetical protein